MFSFTLFKNTHIGIVDLLVSAIDLVLIKLPYAVRRKDLGGTCKCLLITDFHGGEKPRSSMIKV